MESFRLTDTRHMRLRRGLAGGGLAVVLPILALVLNSGSSSPRGLAAPSTPPPPPTYIPTPIGPPPPPPTMTPTATAIPTATAALTASPTAAASATATPGASPTATKAVALVAFSLDAARVSPLNNPGNLKGLAAVKPGTKVELMMYYTIKTLQKNVTRVTTYTILAHAKPIYQVAYKTPQKAGDVGRFSRYTVYTVPKGLAYGPYVFKASLQLGSKSRSAAWKFRVAKQERLATTSGRP